MAPNGYFAEDEEGNMLWIEPTPVNGLSFVKSVNAPPRHSAPRSPATRVENRSIVRRLDFDPRAHFKEIITPPRSVMPPGFSLCQSPSLRDHDGNAINGLVRTGRALRPWVTFGEYNGVLITLEEAKNRKSNYMFEVRVRGKVIHVIDAADPEQSSFLRYVNAANKEEDINAYFYQYNKKIYMKSCRLIKPGEEILTSYGRDTEFIVNNVEVWK